MCWTQRRDTLTRCLVTFLFDEQSPQAVADKDDWSQRGGLITPLKSIQIQPVEQFARMVVDFGLACCTPDGGVVMKGQDP